MTKARDLADLISAGNPLADGAISVSEISDLTASAAELNQLDNTADLPDIRPSLLLDFANSKTLDPRITFTRGSTATYWDGKTTAKAEENLLKYSEQFDNSYWTKSEVTLTANNATAPDGTTTADEVTENTSAGDNRFVRMTNGFAAGTYTYSIYAKIASGSRYCGLRVLGVGDGKAWASYDLTSGTVNTQTGTDITGATITSVGNGWYRLTMTATHTQVTEGLLFGFSTDGSEIPSYTGDGTSGFYIWGAQLENRSSATAYTATTDSPIVKYQPTLQTAASGEARFDHDPVTGESKGLLIEEARTNLFTYSEQFDQWSVSSTTRYVNQEIAPDGTLTADKIAMDTSGGAVIQSQSISSASTYTYSVFMKKAENDFGMLRAQWDGVTYDTVNFDLVNGTTSRTPTGVDSTSITHVGNGWYRCVVTFSPSASLSTNLQVRSCNLEQTSSSGNYTGTFNGFNGGFVWGAQFEEGAFPTSYIPTSGSTVTRSEDFATMPTSTFGFNAVEGTLYNELEDRSASTENTVYSGFLSGNNDRVYFLGHSTQGVRVDNRYAGGETMGAGFSINSRQFGAPMKMAVRYDWNNAAFSLDGSPVVTDGTSRFYLEGANLQIGEGAFGANGTITIKKIAYYPTGLSNATLQAMTEE